MIDIVFFHGPCFFICNAFALSYALHYLKGCLRRETLRNETIHDIITGTDHFLDPCIPVPDNTLGIVDPYIRSVGKPRYADQVGELSRFDIVQHLTNKLSTELRYTIGSMRKLVVVHLNV